MKLGSFLVNILLMAECLLEWRLCGPVCKVDSRQPSSIPRLMETLESTGDHTFVLAVIIHNLGILIVK